MASYFKLLLMVVSVFTCTAGLAGALTLNGAAMYDVTGQEVVVETYDDSTVNARDGAEIAYLDAYDTSDVNVYDGEISYIYAHNDSEVNVYGGDVSWLRMFDNATANLFAVDSLSWLIVDNDSLVNLYGYGFDYSGNHISGYWESGEYFSFWAVENSELETGEFTELLPDNIILHDINAAPVPEPSTFILLSLGALGLVRRKK